MDKNNWRRLYLENAYQLKQLTNDYNKLVEENNNIKDELKNNELDYTTIYINGVYEGKKYYKDKIREKIKEITSYDYTSVEERDCQLYARQVLKELLEEK